MNMDEFVVYENQFIKVLSTRLYKDYSIDVFSILSLHDQNKLTLTCYQKDRHVVVEVSGLLTDFDIFLGDPTVVVEQVTYGDNRTYYWLDEKTSFKWLVAGRV